MTSFLHKDDFSIIQKNLVLEDYKIKDMNVKLLTIMSILITINTSSFSFYK